MPRAITPGARRVTTSARAATPAPASKRRSTTRVSSAHARSTRAGGTPAAMVPGGTGNAVCETLARRGGSPSWRPADLGQHRGPGGARGGHVLRVLPRPVHVHVRGQAPGRARADRGADRGRGDGHLLAAGARHGLRRAAGEGRPAAGGPLRGPVRRDELP